MLPANAFDVHLLPYCHLKVARLSRAMKFLTTKKRSDFVIGAFLLQLTNYFFLPSLIITTMP